jgi:plasmid stability protein
VAQIVVRNLEEQLKVRLQRRARRNGRSMEEEARTILRNALHEQDRPSGGLGSEIAALFRGSGLEGDIPELRGYPVVPPDFES